MKNSPKLKLSTLEKIATRLSAHLMGGVCGIFIGVVVGCIVAIITFQDTTGRFDMFGIGGSMQAAVKVIIGAIIGAVSGTIFGPALWYGLSYLRKRPDHEEEREVNKFLNL